MKKLNLLQPNLSTVYLGENGKEMVYLKIPKELGLDEMCADVENGAEQFKEVRELAKSGKKTAQCVIINCDNAEYGLMAVAYLAAFYNREDEADDYFRRNEEECEYEYEDEFDGYGYALEDDELDSDFADGTGRWQEDPWKIPVVEFHCLDELSASINIFSQNSFAFGGAASGQYTMPAWYHAQTQNICFIADEDSCITVGKLNRYKKNRHIFIIRVKETGKNMIHACFWDPEQNMDKLSEVVFEYAAEVINVEVGREALKAYQENLFENWVENKGYALAGGFPIEKIMKKITRANTRNNPTLIEKTITYVTRDIPEGKELEEKDFSILDKFKMFSGIESKNQSRKSLDRLENELVGMDEVKRQVIRIVSTMKYHRLRSQRGMKNGSFHNVHMMLGAPGTAKTSVAEILGKIMAEEGLLEGDSFIAVNGAELKGEYVGHSAPKVRRIFEENDVIFIDEAYSLAAGVHGKYDSFSQEAVAQLATELEKHGEDRLVLFAGYGGTDVEEKDNRMKDFLDINPGIKSRINTTIFFESYNADQMVDIFMHRAKMEQYTVEKGADILAKEYFAERVDAPDFGNGREARSLFENAVSEAAQRVSAMPEEEITNPILSEIRKEDVKNAIAQIRNGNAAQTGAVTQKQRIGFM